MTMVSVTCLVEAAFAVPAILQHDDGLAQLVHFGRLEGLIPFSVVHGATMWPAIPFVVCGLLVCYGLTALLASMHYVDFITLEDHAKKEIDYYNRLVDEILQDDGGTRERDGGSCGVAAVGAVAARNVSSAVRRVGKRHLQGAKEAIEECSLSRRGAELTEDSIRTNVISHQYTQAVGIAFDDMVERIAERAKTAQERLTLTNNRRDVASARSGVRL